MKQKIGIIGKDCGVRDTAAWADIVILAVPYLALDAVAAEIGPGADGKPLVDATNVITKEGALALKFSASGDEQLQKKMPGAKVVKAFNPVFAQNMSTGKVKELGYVINEGMGAGIGFSLVR
ncbi:MAG: hypothetical protein ABSG85_13180 [Spirochaetia bacterium]|jgi:predicted dinucleotide-binding enzyme